MYFFYLFIFFLHSCYMFPACCFRQRTCVAQGLLNGVFNETWTHSCFLYKWFSFGQIYLYKGLCSFFLECVYFDLLYLIYISDPKQRKISEKNQNCFRINRSTTSLILTICRITEGVRAKNLEATLSVIDFMKVFDTIHTGTILPFICFFQRNCYRYNDVVNWKKKEKRRR